MLKTINGVRLVRYEPQFHAAQLYQWYYSDLYPEFYREFPSCPNSEEIASAAVGKAFMIVGPEGQNLGCIMHFQEDEFSRRFELAMLVDKQFERQGVGLAALKIFLNWKFNFCNLYKAKINVVARNRRLCNALETFGATQEGLLRKESFFDGEFHDIAAYAMFKTDFNKKYQHEFKSAGPRLDAPIVKDHGHGKIETEAVTALPGAAVRGATAAA